MVEHDDAIGIENGVDPMSNGDYGTILEDTTPQRRLQECVSLYVNRRLHPLALACGLPHLSTVVRVSFLHLP